MKRWLSKHTRRSYVSRQDYNLVVILLAVFLPITAFYLLRDAAKSLAFINPQPIQPVVQSVPVYITPETIKDKICATFGRDCGMALKVAKCESGFNPKAKNKTSNARGLFQIMASVHGVKERWLFNPDVNIAIAYQLFQEQGWGPWEASRHCWGAK